MRSQGHVQHLGGDRWRLYVELDPHPLTRKRRQATRVIRAGTKRDAIRALPAFTVEARTARPPQPDRARTVDEALDAFLAHAAERVAPNTHAEWAGSAERYVRPHLGALALGEVTAYRLDVLYRELGASGGKGGARLSPATVRKAHSVIHAALGQATRWGWIDRNPAADASPPRVPKRSATAPDLDAARALLALAETADPDWCTALRFAMATGCRRGELAGLRWGDLDLEAGTARIVRVVQMVAGRARVAEHPKNDESRRQVALGAALVSSLKAVKVRASERALAVGLSVGPDGYVFAWVPGNGVPWHPTSLTRRFRTLRDAAGLPKVRLHDLRHLYATQALGLADVRTVAGRGGWVDADQLLNRYAHFLPVRDRALAEAMDDALRELR